MATVAGADLPSSLSSLTEAAVNHPILNTAILKSQSKEPLRLRLCHLQQHRCLKAQSRSHHDLSTSPMRMRPATSSLAKQSSPVKMKPTLSEGHHLSRIASPN